MFDNLNLAMPEAELQNTIVTCTIEGILEPEDLAALASPSVEGSAFAATVAEEEPDPSQPLKRVREKHHSVARLIASGLSQSLVAMTSGYTESYLSILLNNPAMRELVEFYRIQRGNAAEVIGENLRRVGGKALEAIEKRLSSPEALEGIDIHGLTAVAKLGLDRSGHGPTSTSVNLNETHIVDHAEIKRLDAAARAGSVSRIVNVADVRKALPAPEASDAGE